MLIQGETTTAINEKTSIPMKRMYTWHRLFAVYRGDKQDEKACLVYFKEHEHDKNLGKSEDHISALTYPDKMRVKSLSVGPSKEVSIEMSVSVDEKEEEEKVSEVFQPTTKGPLAEAGNNKVALPQETNGIELGKMSKEGNI